ncbi:cell division protein FtsZ [Bacillus sp. AG4(2022)]|uniref:cell division protein FtsZ n=1 Tax=Bacillus sp. AG4(2022) TaxID=2962594 RepID=UPI0028815CD4|nr:cell division protein FtsZ [Bacillus sp. AG4(2022)]MDT0160296.1 cell division protein FtsZ [Bacillus sp. AG4(2022)]
MYLSVIGLGQAGGNIADEFAKRDFYTAAINFSSTDLNSLEHVEKRLKLIGSEGIGKQRADALSLMNNNWDLAVNFVKENFSHSSVEIILIPFSCAGGSGAGMAPVLLSLLTEAMPEKIFVAAPILPDLKEAYTNQRNALETFEDLSQLGISILPIDNEKAKSTIPNYGKNQLYKKVNERTVDLIESLISYTDRHSKYGILDKKDLKTIFSQPGMATIGETDLSALSPKHDSSEIGFANRIKESWITSFFADVEVERVVSAGFIFDGQERLMEMINMEKVFNNFQNKMPISLFEGYYTGDRGKVMTVLSGLPWCNTRLKQIDDLLTNTSAVLSSINEPVAFKSNHLTHSSPTINNAQRQGKVKDISSLISKFKR